MMRRPRRLWRHCRPWLACVLLMLGLTACSTTPVFYSPSHVAQLAQAGHKWQAAQALAGIDTGPRGHPVQLVIFFDPNCPYCARQYRALKPYLDSVRIHWVPIGTRTGSIGFPDDGCSTTRMPASRIRGAALLGQMHAAAALRENEDRFDFETCRGGYPHAQRALSWALRAVDANTQAMAAFKVYGTPTTLYPTPAGVGQQELLTGAKLARFIHGLTHGGVPAPHP